MTASAMAHGTAHRFEAARLQARWSSGVVEDAFDDAPGASGDAAVVVAQHAVRAVHVAEQQREPLELGLVARAARRTGCAVSR